MKLKLSISLLVSDRTETVKKCLHSLLPLLKAVPSELIIVYTGKEAESLNIVRQYTDHIIPFTWCDDFSAARNAGLREAVGEWFLYIDDDEWFEDCSEIVQFFQSGECEKFKSASYIARNYTNMNGKEYTDIGVTRITRRNPTTKFVGVVHEALSPLPVPVKYFKAFVHHYSYAKHTEDGKILSTERNIPLLLKSIKDNPGGIKNYMQLIQEYLASEQHEEAMEYCHRILAMTGATASGDISADWARACVVLSLMKLGKTKEALSTGLQILEEEYICQLGAMYICLNLIPICSALKQYEEGKKLASLYFKYMDYLDKRPNLWDEQQIFSITRDIVEENRVCVITNGLICGAATGDYEAAKWYLSRFQWTKENMVSSTYDFFEDFKKDFKADKRQILECLSSALTEDTYITFQKALLAELNQEEEQARELYRLCENSEIFYVRYQSILMAMRGDFPLPAFIKDITLDTWRLYASAIAMSGLFEDDSYEDYNRFTMTIQLLFYDYPIHRLILEQKALPRFLLQDRKIQGEFGRIIRRYCQAVIELNRSLYRDELFKPAMSYCLPVECQAAIALDDALLLLDQGSYANGIKALKGIIVAYPDLASLVDKIISNVEQASFKQEAPKNPEFEKLGKQIKVSLQQLMETGQYSLALPIAEKLCELLPEDIEIVRWKQKIVLKLSE